MTDEQVAEMKALEDAALDECILRRGRRSLEAFVARAWVLVEPGRPMVPNWHIGLVCSELEKVPHETRDLVVCIPPGTMKSLLVSVFFPAWLWLEAPEERLLCFANDGDLAKRDSRRMRAVITSEWYRGLIDEMSRRYDAPPWTLAHDQNETINFENSHKGYRACLSLGSTVTGKRCDGMIIDDPLDAKDVILGEPTQVARRIEKINDTIEKVLPTRMNDPKTSWRVIIMQRLHVNDPAARAIDAGATHVVLANRHDPNHPHANPADNRAPGELLFGERFDDDHDESMRLKLGGFHYAAQYGQTAKNKKGGLHKDANFGKVYDFDGQRAKFDEVGLSVDCTFKGKNRGKKVDWVVFQSWGKRGGERYLLDTIRAQMSYPETRAAFKRFCQKWAHASFALIEDKANGSALIDDLHSVYKGVPLIPYHPGRLSKHERAALVAPLWEAGLCFVPSNAPWVNDFVEEMQAFGPGADNDDQVDCQSQILIRWQTEGLADPAALIRRRFGYMGLNN